MAAGETRTIPAAAPTLQELDMDPTQRTIGEPEPAYEPETQPEPEVQPAVENVTFASAGVAEAEGTAGSEIVAEVSTSSSADGLVEPPRSGPGSGRDVWVSYAYDRFGVTVGSDATRDEVIAAVDAAKA